MRTTPRVTIILTFRESPCVTGSIDRQTDGQLGVKVNVLGREEVDTEHEETETPKPGQQGDESGHDRDSFGDRCTLKTRNFTSTNLNTQGSPFMCCLRFLRIFYVL